tara:strand:- start:328 stop:603 length:276 start_codon:yes stop_codon:yes gene_type:complete
MLSVRLLATEVSSAAHPLMLSLLRAQLRLNDFEINHALASFNLHYFLKVMDPLACFFVVVLGGEVWETAKLLRGSWFGLRGPIRLFGFLSL